MHLWDGASNPSYQPLTLPQLSSVHVALIVLPTLPQGVAYSPLMLPQGVAFSEQTQEVALSSLAVVHVCAPIDLALTPTLAVALSTLAEASLEEEQPQVVASLVAMAMQLQKRLQCIFAIFTWVSLAEWSKVPASGASPQGRGLKPHRVQVPDVLLPVLLSTRCVFLQYSHGSVWPSGLRRWLQASVRKGVGLNPTGFRFLSRFLTCCCPCCCLRCVYFCNIHMGQFGRVV